MRRSITGAPPATPPAGRRSASSEDARHVARRLVVAARDAERATTAGGSYAADASTLALAADLRYANADTPWRWGVTLAVGRDAQAVNDRSARMTTDIAAWAPSVAAEVGRAVSERMTLVAGYGVAGYTPYAGVPSPADRGRAYRTLIAPALEMAAAAARSDRATVGGAGEWGGGGAR